jgi:uncharacterized membrane protein YkoI
MLPRWLGLWLGMTAAAVALVPEASAADRRACLSTEQRRAAITSRKAVPLSRVMRSVKARSGGEVLNARLCQREKGLVSVLTVLARDGKVTVATVDAADGQWLEGG